MRSVRDARAGRIAGRATIATGAALAAALFGTGAFAQPVPPQAGQPAAKMEPGKGPGHDGPRHKGPMRFAQDFDRDGHGWRHGRHHGRHHGPRHGMMSPAKLAGALAALETGIGIQPDQMTTWRRFTGSLIAFAEAARPGPGGMGPGGMGPRGPRGMDRDRNGPDTPPAPQAGPSETDRDSPATAGAPDEQGPNDLFAFRMLDRFADRAIEAGDRARELKSALADLESTLTPEQIDRARGLIRSMMRDMREDRRGDRRGGEGRWSDHHRGDRKGPGHHHDRPRGEMPPRGPMEMGPGGPDGPGGPGEDDQDLGPDTPAMDEPQQG